MPATVRRGMRPRTPGPISPATGSTGAPAGMPMSTTRTSPACSLPGLIHSPGLAAANVAVATARTAAPATSPVDASTPLGTSAATTGRVGGVDRRQDPCRGLARRAGDARAEHGVDDDRGPSRRPGRTARRQRAARGGSPPRRRAARPGRPTSRTRTSRPARCSSRATTRPSPPLLPLPQTTATGPLGATSHSHRGQALARALHQRERRDAALLDRPPVGRAHRLGVVERLAQRPARSRDHRHCPRHAARVRQADLHVGRQAGERAVQGDPDALVAGR